MKLKPKGFVAICQCGNIVGAMDYQNTSNKEAGKLLGEWIADGCIVQPKFSATWSCNISPCECSDS